MKLALRYQVGMSERAVVVNGALYHIVPRDEARLDSIWLIGCFGSLLQSRDSLAFRPSPRAGTRPSKQVMEGKVQEETVKYLSDRYGRWHSER